MIRLSGGVPILRLGGTIFFSSTAIAESLGRFYLL